MENIADALKIAGELLIGLLLVSLIVLVFNVMEDAETAKDEQTAIEQTEEFNRRFNAFDKTTMYGTDLISVLGLAYAANKTANAGQLLNSSYCDGYYDADAEGSVNIIFVMNSTTVSELTTTTVYAINQSTNERTLCPVDSGLGVTGSNPKKEITNDIFVAHYTYSLEKAPGDTKTFKEQIIEDAQKSVGDPVNPITLEYIDNILIKGNTSTAKYKKHSPLYAMVEGQKSELQDYIVTDTQGFDQLKKCIFQCTKVDYSDTGRIYQMTFEEKDS